MRQYSELERALIDRWQRDFPLSERPFADIAEALGVSEQTVIETLQGLQADAVVSRIGPVVAPHRAGWSLLAAMAVPEPRLDDVAAIVNAYAEVNHNYRREHYYNLWFVVTGSDRNAVRATLDAIEEATALPVLDLPLEQAFHIDLSFTPKWN